MTEEIKGLHVKDYKQLDVNALEEIIQLNKQLDNNLEKIKRAVNDGVNHQALSLLETLIEDNKTHTDYCIKCQGDVLADMEYTARHFEDYMNVPSPDVYESREPDVNEIDFPNKQINGTSLEECKKLHSEPITQLKCPCCKHFFNCYEVTNG